MGKREKKAITIVGIGASAGGLDAFKQFFGATPADTGMAFVLIPHLDRSHESLMAAIIGRRATIPVVQVEERITVEPDHIYVVPPNRNMVLKDGELVTHEIPSKSGINLPIDVFFHSLAAELAERAVGVILSGTMSDGTLGLKSIKEHGGLVIAQKPETAAHADMPQNAINTGLVDLVLPIGEMPDAIAGYVAHPYVSGREVVRREDNLDQVLDAIHVHSRNDFSAYRRNTLIRRTERRMGLRQIDTMADYVDLLKSDHNEAHALLKDLLIGVTSFFREEEVWRSMRDSILPMIMREREDDAPIRVWIPGCSTGEEAYTIAILIDDALTRISKRLNVQVFATDIDEDAIATARSAVYPENIAAAVPTEYVERYFIRHEHGYQVAKRIRESVVVAVQNVITDAPFSRLDLVSCRNLLIYLEPETQRRILEVFHFSLKPEGHLVLGKSETIGRQDELFETVSKSLRIFRSIPRGDELPRMPFRASVGETSGPTTGSRRGSPSQSSLHIMQSQLLKRFAPAAVLINKKNEVVNFHGPTDRYLRMPQGDPALDITTLVRDGLRTKMRTAVHSARENGESVQVTEARMKRDDQLYPIRFTVFPVGRQGGPDALCLITFEEEPEKGRAPIARPESAAEDETFVRQLEDELSHTREELQNSIEDLETSNEELKASNEEMMSMNEELQSSNEELETSKEELQSLNEELSTVNAELRDKIDELESANNDLENLMNSTDVATVFLEIGSEIRRFTPAAKHLFNLIPSDLGRPIGDLSRRFSDDALADHTQKVMETLTPMSKEVQTDTGRWYTRRILPFRTRDDSVDGVVLTFTDISEIKEKELALEESERRHKNIAETIPGIVLRYRLHPDGSDELLYVSKGVEDFFEVSQEDAIGDNRLLWERVHTDDLESYAASIKESARTITVWQQEHRIQLPDGRIKWMHIRGVPQKQEDGSIVWDSIGLDITDRKEAELRLLESEERFRAIFKQAAAGIAIATETGKLLDVNEAFCSMLGYTRDELLTMTAEEITDPEDRAQSTALESTVRVGAKDALSMLKRYTHKAGHPVWARMESNVVRNATGEIEYVIAAIIDITDQIDAEHSLESAVKEKEVLLREIHHRVKNNMQVISSLIRIQSRKLTDPAMQQSLLELQNRIYAMSTVHETLHQGEDLSHVDLLEYLPRLAELIFRTYETDTVHLEHSVDLESIEVDLEKSYPIGLVVSELLSNSLKYAFPDGKQGEVRISGGIGESGVAEIVVEDNGVGMPADFDWRNTESLGLEIVQSLVEGQLKGHVDLDTRGGTRWTLTVPV